MEFINVIENRRSIRKFKDDDISKEIIDDLIYYASLAPSAHNSQPWYFVITKGELKNKIGEVMFQKAIQNSMITTSNAIKKACTLILVYNNEPNNIFSKESIGASVQNLLLRATDLDLGTLWIGYVKKIEKDIFKITKIDKEIIGAIAVGYKNESPNKRPRKKLDEIRIYL